jgi:hypothetical protein
MKKDGQAHRKAILVQVSKINHDCARDQVLQGASLLLPVARHALPYWHAYASHPLPTARPIPLRQSMVPFQKHTFRPLLTTYKHLW